MDINSRVLETCICGRSFYAAGALRKHLRSCEKGKKRMSGAIDRARDLWRSRKKQRLDTPGPGLSQQIGQSSSEQPNIDAAETSAQSFITKDVFHLSIDVCLTILRSAVQELAVAQQAEEDVSTIRPPVSDTVTVSTY